MSEYVEESVEYNDNELYVCVSTCDVEGFFLRTRGDETVYPLDCTKDRDADITAACIPLSMITLHGVYDIYYLNGGKKTRFGKRLKDTIETEFDRVLVEKYDDISKRTLIVYLTYPRTGVSIRLVRNYERRKFINAVNHMRVTSIRKRGKKLIVKGNAFVSGIDSSKILNVSIFAKPRHSDRYIKLPTERVSAVSNTKKYGFGRYNYDDSGFICTIDVKMLYQEGAFKNRFIDLYYQCTTKDHTYWHKVGRPTHKHFQRDRGESLFLYNTIMKGCQIYPYFSRKQLNLSLMYREKSDYETWYFKLKELVAAYLARSQRSNSKSAGRRSLRYLYRLQKVLALRLFGIRMDDQDVLITGEYKCETAQDNSYYFFKYVRENHPSLGLYYIIKKNSHDKEKLEAFRTHVVDYFSVKHLYLLLTAKVIVSSQGREHLYIFRPLNGRFKQALLKKRYVFLQHGVTAFKKSYFSKNTPNAADKVVATSDIEKRIIMENWGYQDDEVIVTGFPRFDVLEDKSVLLGRKNILIFPTWRRTLDGVDDDVFVESDFFLNYQELLDSERLHTFLRRNDIEIRFYIHIKLKDKIRNFSSRSDRIHFTDMTYKPVNELLMEASLLITDYSSVAWDFHYLAKPVSFFQFDQEQYLRESGSFIDFNTQLFGNVSCDAESLVEDVILQFNKGSIGESTFFKYHDRNNSERIYQELSAYLSD